MKNSIHKHIHAKLLLQLIIFFVLAIGMLIAVGFDMFTGRLSFVFAAGSLAIGIIIGLAVGRMFAIKWHEDTQKIIVAMDKTSFLIIGLYIVFRVAGDQLFGHFFHGETLTAITFSLVGGIMIGRFFSMMRSILKILKKQNLR